MKRLAFSALFLCLFSFTFINTVNIESAYALTIDEFNDGGPAGAAEVANLTPTTASSNILSTSAVGGSRLLYISRSSAFNGGTTRIFTNTRLFHSQDGGVRAFSRVTWDKDADPLNSVIPNGLSSIDMSQDGGSELKLITTFDYANTQPIDLTVRLYDSSDVSGNTYSQVSLTLNQVLSDFTLTIPYSKFTSFGAGTIPAPVGSFATFTFYPGAPVNMSRVGAIVLEINGQNGDSDISIDSLKTNGRCVAVPDADGKVIDDCGICAGDPGYKQSKDDCGICAGQPGYQSSKDDCGVCFGNNAGKDDCGVCFGNNTGKDTCGVCFGNNVAKDDCGICFGNNASKDSCGLCPSVPNYNNAKDPCGVCFGNGSSCADCSGTPNGNKTLDICGVCNGAGNTCLDCAGMPFGTKGLDICNVCGGNGSTCLDCKGIPFGSTKSDACGTCGGTIADAADCNVTPFCVTVQATSDILAFEQRLVEQTKTITKKYKEEEKRGKRNKCGINTKPSTTRVTSAYETITDAGKEIFTKGVEICGEGCVTVSFADQVQALAPKLKIIEKQTTSLAKKVQACYKRKRIKTTQGVNGVATTIKNVQKDLTQLIKDCKDQKVCS